jgi:signal peptidase I
MSSEQTQEKKSGTHQFVELVLIVAVAVGLAFGIQALLVKPYRIPSGSMEPTLAIGQRVLVNRLAADISDPAVGDIMVFTPPSGASPPSGSTQPQCGVEPPVGQACGVPTKGEADDTFIKRVVGLPGDKLSVVGGHVIRNGKRESDSYINPCSGGQGCDFPRTFTVPPDHYFMMGDNRGNSDDSRYWGPIPRSSIIGEAFATYWPPDRIGLL